MTLPLEVTTWTWTALVGTVGLALVALVWFAYLFRIGTRALGGNDDVDADAVSAARRPQGRVALDKRGDNDSALLQVQQDLARRAFARRCEAAAADRGPARLNGRDVSDTSSVPLGKGAA